MKNETRLIMESQLNNVCKILNGKWYRTSLLNSRGETEERIIISYSNFDASGNDIMNKNK
tara:strand:- start:225 stop:404 length:180 start_codon:yes stop_codon:yes gene_type:complete